MKNEGLRNAGLVKAKTKIKWNIYIMKRNCYRKTLKNLSGLKKKKFCERNVMRKSYGKWVSGKWKCEGKFVHEK